MSLGMGGPPVLAMGAGLMATAAGATVGLVGVDAAVGIALLLQFGGVVWWGSRMQTRQDGDRERAAAQRDEQRDERIATMAQVHRDVGALDSRLVQIERHGSAEVQHMVIAVTRLTELAEETNRRLASVEATCSVRHAGKGQPI